MTFDLLPRIQLHLEMFDFVYKLIGPGQKCWKKRRGCESRLSINFIQIFTPKFLVCLGCCSSLRLKSNTFDTWACSTWQTWLHAATKETWSWEFYFVIIRTVSEQSNVSKESSLFVKFTSCKKIYFQ